MKKTLFLFVTAIFFLFYVGKSFGQCTPDPLVTDPEGNGEMVPDTLEAIETVPLNQTLTIIAPATAVVMGGSLSIDHITVRSLQNKPSWLSSVCNPGTCEFAAGVKNCVLATGTPPVGTAGYYSVTVLVDVYSVIITGNPAVCMTCSLYPSGYDSGMPLVVWVHPASFGITEFANKGFGIIPPQPNPFNNETKIGCYTDKAQTVSFKVVDMVGKEIYSEKLNTNTGENYFNFNGNNLSNGIYFYSVIDAQNHVITKKMIKSK